LVPKLKNSGAEAEELGFARYLVGQQRRARDLDHRSDEVFLLLQTGLLQNLVGHFLHDGLLVLEFLHATDQRNHHFGNDLLALLGHLHHGLEDGARLHLRDLGIGDAQAAAAMPQHGVHLMQALDALQQVGQHRLEIPHLGAEVGVPRHHFLLGLEVGGGQLGDVHHQLFALWNELVQRRVERVTGRYLRRGARAASDVARHVSVRAGSEPGAEPTGNAV
jgi:hypothetical protein